MDDEELARVLEEGAERADDDHVRIKEQLGAAQAVQVGFKVVSFFMRRRVGLASDTEVQRRDRQALYLRPNAGGVVMVSGQS